MFANVFILCSDNRLGCLFPPLRFDSDKLREELTDYQVADSKELPQEQRVDRFWSRVGKDERFRQQRTFSMVKKKLLQRIEQV